MHTQFKALTTIMNQTRLGLFHQAHALLVRRWSPIYGRISITRPDWGACHSCGSEPPLTQRHIKKGGPSGHRNQCSPCPQCPINPSKLVWSRKRWSEGNRSLRTPSRGSRRRLGPISSPRTRSLDGRQPRSLTRCGARWRERGRTNER
jgi:hypothetical protein